MRTIQKGVSMSDKYSIKIWLWTGDMNTYHHETISDLDAGYAEKLFNAIQVNGEVTQVDMFKGDTRIISKDEESVFVE